MSMLPWPQPSFPPPDEPKTPEQRALIDSRSNRWHSHADYFFGTMAYTMGTLMHAVGQSNLMCFLGHWGAGTYFFVTAEKRRLHGPGKDAWFNEMSASWLWCFAAFQQFKLHAKFRWCGYSSWTGLMLSTYYSFRTMYVYVTEE